MSEVTYKLIPDFHPQATLTEVTYKAQGLKVKGYLCLPKGEGPHPLLVYCRGGIKRVGMTRLAWVSHYVNQGYAVFAPFYRGNRGGEGREDFGGEDRYDVIDALPWLKRHPLLDPARFHLLGFSRGSIMALFTAMEDHDICSVIVWGGVSDLTLTYEERIDLRRMLKRVIGGTPNKRAEEYRRRSPVYEVDKLQCPVLIIHGSEDVQVSVRHAYSLAEALKAAQKPYTLRIYEGRGHHLHQEEFTQAIQDMFSWIKEQEGQVHGRVF